MAINTQPTAITSSMCAMSPIRCRMAPIKTQTTPGRPMWRATRSVPARSWTAAQAMDPAERDPGAKRRRNQWGKSLAKFIALHHDMGHPISSMGREQTGQSCLGQPGREPRFVSAVVLPGPEPPGCPCTPD